MEASKSGEMFSFRFRLLSARVRAGIFPGDHCRSIL